MKLGSYYFRPVLVGGQLLYASCLISCNVSVLFATCFDFVSHVRSTFPIVFLNSHLSYSFAPYLQLKYWAMMIIGQDYKQGISY
jgi:hypothetical protein